MRSWTFVLADDCATLKPSRFVSMALRPAPSLSVATAFAEFLMGALRRLTVEQGPAAPGAPVGPNAPFGPDGPDTFQLIGCSLAPHDGELESVMCRFAP